ncbi:MAG TPA: hypothetical protein VFQ25_09460 [Ktedonobacterales bacterium]|nr:hypothetical protein [Ktedonobacterales bacterium]
MRTLGMISGILASVVAVIVDFLYSFFHVLGRVTGITNDSSHFWWGLLVTLIGFVGSLLSIGSPVLAAILMLIAGVAFFWLVGWWAIFASVFFFIGAALVILDSRRAPTTTGTIG